MKLSRNSTTEKLLFKKFREHLSRTPRTGVHVSDLIDPLLAYWKRKLPKPLTDDECLYFLDGISHHTMIEAAVGTQEHSLLDEETGVTYSPDLYEMVAEIKTTRRDKIPTSEEEAKRAFPSYIKQCRMYAALMCVTLYKLVVNFYAVAIVEKFYTRKRPALRVYDLMFTESELKRERKKIASLSETFRNALTSSDPSALPLCTAWKCYEILNGKKQGRCPWWDDCQPKGRYGDVEQLDEDF